MKNPRECPRCGTDVDIILSINDDGSFVSFHCDVCSIGFHAEYGIPDEYKEWVQAVEKMYKVD